jgi:hypothetical protein
VTCAPPCHHQRHIVSGPGLALELAHRARRGGGDPGATLAARAGQRRGQPPGLIARADRTLRRLTLRQRRMTCQGKHPSLVTVAVARELLGNPWHTLLQTVPTQG